MQKHLQSSKSLLVSSKCFVLTTLDLQATPSQSQSDKYPSDTQPTRMIDLPDDILISVFSLCSIDAILNLRLTCASFCAVIRAYIATIAPASARITFPNCDLLLKTPRDGYNLRWLINLIPAQLASIALDKDKLRRHPYINSGFLYGIPSESDCREALFWRQRLANGWKVLRSFYLISSRVYKTCEDDCKRPNAFRKVSGGLRTSRIWQAMSCQYAGCTEHGMKHVFGSKHHRDSHASHAEEQKEPKDHISEVRRREAQILKQRLARLGGLSDQDLLDYAFLWRLLLHIFRPYGEPEITVYDFTQSWSPHTSIPCPSWPNMISDMAQGCSWLNWLVLHIGTDPFQIQWAISPTTIAYSPSNYIRNIIWRAWSARSTHQIEIEREHISKFEFALRKRCLSSERLKRLEAEIFRGRTINTISLDCIPWVYDQHHRIPRSPTDFPWYKPERPLRLAGGWVISCSPERSWTQPGALKGDMRRFSKVIADDESQDFKLDPLANVPYLVYLGVEEASKIWPGSDGDGTEFAF